MRELTTLEKTYKIALFVSLSCVFQMLESFIPHPIPGLRLGLANMVTLIALFQLGFKPAMEVAIIRTVVSAFFIGTFMSPAFILSFFAAILSTLVMGLCFLFSTYSRHLRLSIIGISVVGAMTHNIVQLYLAFFLLVRHKGIFIFLPWLMLGAVITGVITGIFGRNICLRLAELKGQGISYSACPIILSQPVFTPYVQGNSFIHRMPAKHKIVAIFAISIIAFVANNIWLFAGLYTLFFLSLLFSHIPVYIVLSSVKRYAFLVLSVLMFPVLFSFGQPGLSMIKPITQGALFTARIVFLILTSYLFTLSTPSRQIVKGFEEILVPLERMGISAKRIAFIMALCYEAVPVFLQTAKTAIKTQDIKSLKNIKNLAYFLQDIIVKIYVAGENLFHQEIFYPEEHLHLAAGRDKNRGAELLAA